MSPEVTVRPARSRRDLKSFVDFPYRLYRDNPFWIPPLRLDTAHAMSPRRNPFFEHGSMQPFVAEDGGGRIVGRVAAIVNGMHLKKYADATGFFGFFECEDRYEVAAALLDAACGWLRERDIRAVRGPTNPSLNDTAGLLVKGFDREPSVLMPYNPACYGEFLARHGFERTMTMWAYYVHKKYVQTEKMRRGVELLHRRNPGLRIRKMDLKRFPEEARTVLRIYNDAWSRNWGHVPITDGEFARLAKDLRKIVDPEIVFILEKDGEPIGFSISLPNVNQLLKRVPDGRLFPFGLVKLLILSKTVRIYECRTAMLGILPPYQGKGFDAILNLATIEEGPRHGYDASEMSWVLDSNDVMKNALVSMGAVVDKEYAMFGKAL